MVENQPILQMGCQPWTERSCCHILGFHAIVAIDNTTWDIVPIWWSHQIDIPNLIRPLLCWKLNIMWSLQRKSLVCGYWWSFILEGETALQHRNFNVVSISDLVFHLWAEYAAWEGTGIKLREHFFLFVRGFKYYSGLYFIIWKRFNGLKRFIEGNNKQNMQLEK